MLSLILPVNHMSCKRIHVTLSHTIPMECQGLKDSSPKMDRLLFDWSCWGMIHPSSGTSTGKNNYTMLLNTSWSFRLLDSMCIGRGKHWKFRDDASLQRVGKTQNISDNILQSIIAWYPKQTPNNCLQLSYVPESSRIYGIYGDFKCLQTHSKASSLHEGGPATEVYHYSLHRFLR